MLLHQGQNPEWAAFWWGFCRVGLPPPFIALKLQKGKRSMQWTDSSTVLQSRPLNARMKGKVYGSPCTTMHTMHNLRSRKKRRKTFVNLVPRVPLKKATKKASWSNLSGRYNTSPLSPPLSVTIRDSPFEKLRWGGRGGFLSCLMIFLHVILHSAVHIFYDFHVFITSWIFL